MREKISCLCFVNIAFWSWFNFYLIVMGLKTLLPKICTQVWAVNLTPSAVQHINAFPHKKHEEYTQTQITHDPSWLRKKKKLWGKTLSCMSSQWLLSGTERKEYPWASTMKAPHLSSTLASDGFTASKMSLLLFSPRIFENNCLVTQQTQVKDW